MHKGLHKRNIYTWKQHTHNKQLWTVSPVSAFTSRKLHSWSKVVDFIDLCSLVTSCYSRGSQAGYWPIWPICTTRFAWVNTSSSFPAPAPACSLPLDCLESSLKSRILAHISPPPPPAWQPLYSQHLWALWHRRLHTQCLPLCLFYLWYGVFQFHSCCETIVKKKKNPIMRFLPALD